MGSNVTGIMGMMGAGMNAYQDHVTAKEERAKAERAAREYEARAALHETEAEELRTLGTLDRAEHGVKARAARSARRADYARSGVRVDSGSPLETLADQAAWTEYERQRLEYETNLKAWGLNQEAAALRSRAASARRAGRSMPASAPDIFGYMGE